MFYSCLSVGLVFIIIRRIVVFTLTMNDDNDIITSLKSKRVDDMLKSTDIKRVKEVAQQLLQMDIIQDKEFPFIVRHPFFDFIEAQNWEPDYNENYVMLDTEEGQRVAKKTMSRIIDMVSQYEAFLEIVKKPYLPLFFKLTQDYLSLKDYSVFLSKMWINVEFSNSDKYISSYDFIALFKKADKKMLMNNDELKTFKSLPDTLTVYRGVKPNATIEALSWSLKKETALWFANRFEENGKVYAANIKKHDILAYFDERKEAEIVVDFTKLYGIKEV